MANLCSYCERKWPPEPVRTLILGDDWIECCSECYEGGKGEFTNSVSGEKMTFKELYELLEESQRGV